MNNDDKYKFFTRRYLNFKKYACMTIFLEVTCFFKNHIHIKNIFIYNIHMKTQNHIDIFDFGMIGVDHHIDRVWLLIDMDIEDFEREKKERFSLDEQRKTWARRNTFYADKTSISLLTPKLQTLEALKELIADREHIITKIEVAKDTAYLTREQALLALEDVFLHHRYKHATKNFFYGKDNWRKIHREEKCTGVDDIFSVATLYSKSKFFELVAYGRIGKTTRLPCVHTEWRIRKPRNIAKYLRVTNIDSLIAFNACHAYDNLDDKYLVKVSINYSYLSMMLTGLQDKEHKATKHKCIIRAIHRRRIKLGLAGKTFCKLCELYTPEELINYIEKYFVKNKLLKPKATWTKRLKLMCANKKRLITKTN